MNAASVGTRCASGTRGTGRTYRTRGTGCTVMHHKGSGRSIREVDGIGVVQTAGRRTGNRHNTAAVLTIGAVGAVLTVQHIEGVRAVEVRDGHLCAGGCGSGHYNRRETIRAVGAVLTGRTGRTLGTLLSGGTVTISGSMGQDLADPAVRGAAHSSEPCRWASSSPARSPCRWASPRRPAHCRLGPRTRRTERSATAARSRCCSSHRHWGQSQISGRTVPDPKESG